MMSSVQRRALRLHGDLQWFTPFKPNKVPLWQDGTPPSSITNPSGGSSSSYSAGTLNPIATIAIDRSECPACSRDSWILFACHEFGHWLSGNAFGEKNQDWLNDWWAALVCAPQVVHALIGLHNVDVTDVGEVARVTPRTLRYKQQCDRTFGYASLSAAENKHYTYICYRIARAGEDVSVGARQNGRYMNTGKTREVWKLFKNNGYMPYNSWERNRERSRGAKLTSRNMFDRAGATDTYPVDTCRQEIFATAFQDVLGGTRHVPTCLDYRGRTKARDVFLGEQRAGFLVDIKWTVMN